MLMNPLRRLIQNPDKILNKYLGQNMKVMDIGCGMGYFSLPAARLVGEGGNIICIDLQNKMIDALVKRAERERLHNRIKTRVC